MRDRAQVRFPPVGLEQRIVIRTEMSRYVLPVNRGVKHAAHVGARDDAALDAEADQTAIATLSARLTCFIVRFREATPTSTRILEPHLTDEQQPV